MGTQLTFKKLNCLPLAAPSSLIPCCATLGNDFLSLRFFTYMQGTQLPLENSVRANNV